MTPETKKTISYTGHKDATERLRLLHEYYELSWPQIARLEEYQGIPPSSLAKMAKSEIIMKKWRHRFPGVGAVDNRPRVAVHMHNTDSGARTINRHIKDTGALENLIIKLQNKLAERKEKKTNPNN